MNYYLLIAQVLFLILNTITEVEGASLQKELYECEVTDIDGEDLDETFIISYNLFNETDLTQFQEEYKKKLNITITMNYANIEIQGKPFTFFFSEDTELNVEEMKNIYSEISEEELYSRIGKLMYIEDEVGEEENINPHPIGQYRYDSKLLKNELKSRNETGSFNLTCYNAIHLHIENHCFDKGNVTNFGVVMNGEFRTMENEGECNWVASIPKRHDDLEFHTIFYKYPDDPNKFGFVRKNETSSWMEGEQIEGKQNPVKCEDHSDEGIDDIRIQCNLGETSSESKTTVPTTQTLSEEEEEHENNTLDIETPDIDLD